MTNAAGIVLALIVVGGALWGVAAIIPTGAMIKRVLSAAIAVAGIAWLLDLLANAGH